jgi:sulfur-oxidizing protein SoxX
MTSRKPRSAEFLLASALLPGLALLPGPTWAADPQAGRAIVENRNTGMCVMCHSGPFPDPHLQGNLAPDLRGVGARLTPDEIREHLVDPRRFNPDSIMPSYSATTGLTRVGAAWRGKPLLTEAQMDDVVAYLATLKTPP